MHPPPQKPIKPVVLHANTIAQTTSDRFPDPSIGGDISWKTLLSSPSTTSDTFTVGIATCEPGNRASCPAGHLNLHRHTHAELYYVVSGRGVVSIDGEEHEVGEGSVVFIPGDAEHGMKCVGDEEVRWLYVFAADGFGEIGYRFSGAGQVKAKL